MKPSERSIKSKGNPFIFKTDDGRGQDRPSLYLSSMKPFTAPPWSRALRWPFLAASVVPLLAGTGFAWLRIRHFSPLRFIFAGAGLCCLHLGTNILNDYFDHRSGNDEINLKHSPFNGGSRVIQEGLLRPSQILRTGAGFLAAALAIGAALIFLMPGPVIPVLGLIALVSGAGYTAAPFAWGYRGVGEFVVGLNFGPLAVLGSSYVQTGSFDWGTLWIGIPIGCLISAVLLVNEIPDREADASVNKKTWVVRHGDKSSVILFTVLIFIAFFICFLGIVLRALPLPCLAVLLSLIPAKQAVGVLSRFLGSGEYSFRANALTVRLHLFFGFLVSAGLFAGAWG
jgi:1,4-dihydroxy-2-naphthoate octaprenyltransferase